MAAEKCGRKRSSPCTSDEGAACWICLDDESDESAQPLRRDCSCRGNSGFVHLSCIANYAEQLTREMSESRDSGKFIMTWTACPNCHQDYEHELAADLVARCTSFVERNYPGDLWFCAHAVYLKLRKLAIRRNNRDEGAQIATEVISIVEQMRTESSYSLTRAILYFEIAAYESLALFAESEGTKESLKDAVEFHTRCRDIYVHIGIPTDIAHAEACITQAKSKYNGDEGWTKDDVLKDCQDYYKESVEEGGEESCVAMISTFRLADALRASHHGIEAERLITKLAAIAHRVHGSDHDFTKDVEASLLRYKRRYVFIKGRLGKHFVALRYADGDKCVVQGPVSRPRNIEEEKTFTVHTDELRPALGTPITCHGLEKLNHINIGHLKVGDVRSREKGAQKFKVHFEDSNLEPCLVSPRNMRIVFELPSKE
mmetsp:Transcript_8328/g.15089  ORF Transcript_8328/g.15089 Transcript_8328/m.15089 type:complete len:429 (-) Transcript_8328:143-1429(-)|eukprot:CAMPEP_0201890272 /NCGR_PEP_ID=MMETSP0902-20130614/31872_1 /ASSEMBLY_ACC=CAM_ASM_000551 /TAXON_ID=420261 /ORGANISM="Thalassiosira antarctica, Strain CCMP982" /LENGTH=428 /DNA_ID=CAMNT_0048421087 /DNA_START=86 /DNA_END=1372 /DNA_ORIENTATION=+